MANRLKKIKKDQEDLLGFKLPEENEYGLTPSQEAFAKHYTREANATLAAKLAGYSAHTAGQIGFELLRLPKIYLRIQAIRLETKNGDQLREKIINKLMNMAELDPAKLYEDDGHTLKPIHEWDLESRQAINGFETRVGTTGINKVKLTDKAKALDMLIKMQGYNAPEKIANTDLDGNHVPAIININVVPPQKE